MEAVAADPSTSVLSAAVMLPAPPYHHSPSPADDVATPPPKPKPSTVEAVLRTPSPSPSVLLSGYSLHDLLLLSPPAPSSRRHRSRTRGAAGMGLDENLEMVVAAETPTPPRRRRRGTADQCVAPALASPRNTRRARRRLEKDVEADEDTARRARRRKSTRAAPKAAAAADKLAAVVPNEKDKSLVLVPACRDGTHETDFVEQSGWEGLRERIVELVMWRNVAKSALCPISALCHLGVMILGLAFFKDSVPRRTRGRNFQLTEEHVLCASRVVLPIANSMVSTAQVIFSGEPSMTLKVLPVLLFGAKYGSLVTVWRLVATGFFTSFTVPKLYSCYSIQIHNRVEILTDWALEAWKSCPRKKLAAAMAVTMCWNMFSVKTRIMAAIHIMLQSRDREQSVILAFENHVTAFVSLVMLRYNQKCRKVDITTEVESCKDDQRQIIGADVL
ncbi:hypothetical protein U9M48_024382 [Paspalum notatum var. saurae]|uniref:Reticulon domain-containing protein n=1 Tax=Paspalum notatum var. saurae TaxID=547442 RepID=A0AAQ3WWK4_PASNO